MVLTTLPVRDFFRDREYDEEEARLFRAMNTSKFRLESRPRVFIAISIDVLMC